MKIVKVISGGQTGADQGGLEAAMRLGVPTGGWAPKGWKTEAGPREAWMRVMGMRESTSGEYPHRTRLNVADSHFTILISGGLDKGSLLTYNLCRKMKRPVFHVSPTVEKINVDVVRDVMNASFFYEDLILNVAGNRESRSPGICMQTRRLITKFLREFNHGP